MLLALDCIAALAMTPGIYARNQSKILLPSSRTRTHAAITMLADRIASVLRDNPDGLASSERWIGPLPKD